MRTTPATALALALTLGPALAGAATPVEEALLRRLAELEAKVGQIDALKREVRRLRADAALRRSVPPPAGPVSPRPAAPVAPPAATRPAPPALAAPPPPRRAGGALASTATRAPAPSPAAAPARADRTAALARKTEILTREVRRLREDIELPPEKKKVGRYGMGPAASKVYQQDRGVSIGGYGQGWYTGFTGDESRDDTETFDLVRNVMYFGYKFSDELVLNTEIEWEHATTSGGSVSVEFAQIDHLRNEKLNLRAGLLLAPVGFVNEIHEPQTYMGNQRPEVERRIIPSTWREGGFGAFGRLSPKLEYRAYLMNSLRAGGFSAAGIRGGRQRGSRARAEGTSLALRLDATPTPNLTLGTSLYVGDQGQSEDFVIDAAGNTARPDVGMNLFELHGEWRHGPFGMRALGAWTRLSDAGVLSQAKALAGEGAVAERMTGRYVEARYDLFHGSRRWRDKRLDAFFRFERFDTHARVPLGFARDASRDVTVRTTGLQYYPHPDVVFKLDFRNFGSAGGRLADEVNLGFGWVF